MRGKFSSEERRILKALDAAVRTTPVRAALDEIAARVEQKLRKDATASLAWEPVPLSAYDAKLPEGIRSSWVFVLRAGTTSGAERHPNSHQRMMSWRGTGDMHLWKKNKWKSNVLTPNRDAALEERWVSIPVNVWHKPVMGPETWVVVSFHTVPADELIEERGDPESSAETQRHTYAAMADDKALGSR